MRPGFDAMIQLFQRSGLHFSQEIYRSFWVFHKEVRKKNELLDLTRIRNFENMVIKHYVDSALVTQLIPLPSPLLDIGSGAGFPGIPIKIVRPDIHLILAEGRKKRALFLEDMCRVLSLDNVEVYPHKIYGEFDQPVRGIITRALEAIPKTLERVAPFLPRGGQVIFMKGPRCEGELEQAKRMYGEEFNLKQDIPYHIPGTQHKRRLAVFVKKSEAHKKLPGGDIRRMKVKEIISVGNPTFKNFVNLLGARGIKKQAMALLSGPKQVREVLATFPERCAGLIFSDPRDFRPLPHGMDVPLYRLSPELFRKIDLHNTRSPILLVRVPDFPRWDSTRWPSGCTLCVPFQDPANVGAVIRSAAAFGVPRVVMLEEASHPFHPKSARVAGSSLLRIPIYQGPSLDRFEVREVPTVTLSPEGKDIAQFRFPERFCLVPGLEGPGLPEHLRKTEVLAIPMASGVESVNSALATGIALYLWRRSLGGKDGA